MAEDIFITMDTGHRANVLVLFTVPRTYVNGKIPRGPVLR